MNFELDEQDLELKQMARDLATKLAQQPPIPVELTKKMVWRYLLDGIERQLDLETYAQRICWQSEDHREAVHAFMEKGYKPQFKGK